MAKLEVFTSETKAAGDKIEPGDSRVEEIDPAQVLAVKRDPYGRRGSLVFFRGGRMLHAVGDVRDVRALLGWPTELAQEKTK